MRRAGHRSRRSPGPVRHGVDALDEHAGQHASGVLAHGEHAGQRAQREDGRQDEQPGHLGHGAQHGRIDSSWA